MPSEAEIEQAIRHLLLDATRNDVSRVAEAEALLGELRPGSPLRERLAGEIAVLRRDRITFDDEAVPNRDLARAGIALLFQQLVTASSQLDSLSAELRHETFPHRYHKRYFHFIDQTESDLAALASAFGQSVEGETTGSIREVSEAVLDCRKGLANVRDALTELGEGTPDTRFETVFQNSAEHLGILANDLSKVIESLISEITQRRHTEESPTVLKPR